MPFRYFVLSLREITIIDKTTRINYKNKALISAAKYFAPLFIVFQPRILSSFRQDITINFVISGEVEKNAILRFSPRNNEKTKFTSLFRGEVEKTQFCVFSISPRNDAKLRG